MPICKKCGKSFTNWITINGKKRNLHSRKFCLECSPFGQHNTIDLNIVPESYKANYCKHCGKEFKKTSKVYCSPQCKKEFEHQEYIQKWKNHQVTGIRNKNGQLSEHIRKYIFEKYDYKCSVCGWSEINPYTNTIPLEIDHVDGNWENSYEENLVLLCPNCHSLTPTYKGANRGHGRNITWIVKEK